MAKKTSSTHPSRSPKNRTKRRPLTSSKTITAKEFETVERRRKVFRLMVQGYTPSVIASTLHVSIDCIRADLAEIRTEVHTAYQSEVMEHVRRKLLENEIIRQDAFEAWERSKENATEMTTEEDPEGEGKERIVTKVKKKVWGRDGDPRFLDIRLKCIQMDMKLLGLDRDDDSKLEEVESSQVVEVVVASRDEIPLVMSAQQFNESLKED